VSACRFSSCRQDLRLSNGSECPVSTRSTLSRIQEDARDQSTSSPPDSDYDASSSGSDASSSSGSDESDSDSSENSAHSELEGMGERKNSRRHRRESSSWDDEPFQPTKIRRLGLLSPPRTPAEPLPLSLAEQSPPAPWETDADIIRLQRSQLGGYGQDSECLCWDVGTPDSSSSFRGFEDEDGDDEAELFATEAMSALGLE
jgi:hypothetical protein